MIALLGSVLGFLTSGVPNVLKFFQDKLDKKHELELMEAQLKLKTLDNQQQIELAKLNQQNIAAVGVQQMDLEQIKGAYAFANQPSGVRWVDALVSSVRPVITYAFFALFAGVEISLVVNILSSGGNLADAFTKVWDEDTRTLFATIISFWFGHRAWKRCGN